MVRFDANAGVVGIEIADGVELDGPRMRELIDAHIRLSDGRRVPAKAFANEADALRFLRAGETGDG